jgi:aminomethyltransferase
MFPFENEAPGDTLWELGLDFTVSPGKAGFRGAEEHYRLKGKERFKIYGLLIDGTTTPDGGTMVTMDGKPAGVVTCAMHSRLTGKTMAIARLSVPAAVQGTKLKLSGKNVETTAIAHPLPFDDPKKTKRTAVG